MPTARVLTWGYNASFSSLSGQKPSKDRIHHHAQTLIQELYSDRMVRVSLIAPVLATLTDPFHHHQLENRLDKPIIFLCHSLGGIVVKRVG
jgi:hypothetical protein